MKLTVKLTAFDMMLSYIASGHEELARIYAMRVYRSVR
jgi:hypothetical protein